MQFFQCCGFDIFQFQTCFACRAVGGNPENMVQRIIKFFRCSAIQQQIQSAHFFFNGWVKVQVGFDLLFDIVNQSIQKVFLIFPF